RAREAARTAADHGRRGTARGLSRQKTSEVSRHTGIRGVREPELLQSRGLPSRWHVPRPDDGKEPVEEHLIEILPAKRRTKGAADETAAFAEDRDRVVAAIGMREQRLFRDAALVPQGL